MESTKREQVLDGVCAVALAANIPGPLAAAELARLGAAVTKIEPLGGDPLAIAAPDWYASIVRDLRVVQMDLKRSQEALLGELARADLLLTAMRGRALASAGLAWQDLHEKFPRLIHVAVLGEAPPNEDRAGHDLTYQARAGLLAPPGMPRTIFADMFAAQSAIAAGLLALYERERTGLGTRREIAIADGAKRLAQAVEHGLAGPAGVLGGAFAGYRIYRSADGWVALAALERHFQLRLLEALQLPELNSEELQARFAERTSDYWEAMAEREDLPLAKVEM